MSYLIAFVRFSGADQLYPVNCMRKDIAIGDRVLVATPEGNKYSKPAVVENLSYLNWNCGFVAQIA